jgi:hypothetical protein
MLGNPDDVGMDEDYDACDLENWFLAIQSADGQVVVPSFHRPGILRADLTDPSYPTTPSRPTVGTIGGTPRPTRRPASCGPAGSTATRRSPSPT